MQESDVEITGRRANAVGKPVINEPLELRANLFARFTNVRVANRSLGWNATNRLQMPFLLYIGVLTFGLSVYRELAVACLQATVGAPSINRLLDVAHRLPANLRLPSAVTQNRSDLRQ